MRGHDKAIADYTVVSARIAGRTGAYTLTIREFAAKTK